MEDLLYTYGVSFGVAFGTYRILSKADGTDVGVEAWLWLLTAGVFIYSVMHGDRHAAAEARLRSAYAGCRIIADNVAMEDYMMEPTCEDISAAMENLGMW